ncbi:tetratricopeptide repeat protein, partial [Helicobacter ailurogastricus]|uniref:tetratricopeptide repeat protein n=1 Tax=Helicobacter ailurogastricus TaxID=1578720 RepID=UPI00255703B2
MSVFKRLVGVVLISAVCLGGVGVSDQVKQTLDLARKAYMAGDYAKAFEYDQQAAKMGSARAYVNLGDLYKLGEGVKKDETKAEEYYQQTMQAYQKEGDGGDALAYVSLGLMYSEPHRPSDHPDYPKAMQYFKKAIDMGEPAGYYALAEMYQSGQGVKADMKMAGQYYQKACDLGYQGGCFKVKIYSATLKNEPNHANSNKEADKYLDIAHKAYDEKNYSKAVQYLQKAVEMGNSSAFYNLGSMYEHGKGLSQDYSKALEYYQKAA